MSTATLEPPVAVQTVPELGRVYLGDCLGTMKTWPPSFVDAVVTSSPYFHLRSYLPDGHESKAQEIGHSETYVEYLDRMGAVMAELHRITKPAGTFWLNVGDTWCTTENRKLCPPNFQLGEQLDVPHWLIDRARKAGWRKVSEVVWFKPNSNPHFSGRYPMYAHEFCFQFVKGTDYFYDPLPIMETASEQPDTKRTLKRHARSVWSIPTVSMNGRKLMADFKQEGRYLERDPACPFHGDDPKDEVLPLFAGTGDMIFDCSCKEVQDDFFAAMPPKLAERLIRCSTSDVGNCSLCGVPASRLTKKDRVATRPGKNVKKDPAKKARKDPGRHVSYVESIGATWNCKCVSQSQHRVAPIVFDPFCGSGTTPVAAVLSGRNWLGCELNPLMVERLIPARLKAAMKGK